MATKKFYKIGPWLGFYLFTSNHQIDKVIELNLKVANTVGEYQLWNPDLKGFVATELIEFITEDHSEKHMNITTVYNIITHAD